MNGGVDDEGEWTDAELGALAHLRRIGRDDSTLSPEARDRLWRQLADDPEIRASVARHLRRDTDPAEDDADLARPDDAPGERFPAPGALVTRPRTGRGQSAGRRTATVGLVAAALVAVVLAFALTAPTHPDPEIASEDTRAPATSPVAPASLDVLADRAAARTGPVLGEPGAVYAHRVTVRAGRPGLPGEPTPALQMETWIALDGNGRRIAAAPGDAPGEEDTRITDGSLLLADLITPAVALALPTEPEPLLARLRELAGFPPGYLELGDVVVGLLAEAGVPAPVRAALLRGLGVLGFRPTVDADGLGPAFEGPAFDGGTFVVVLDDDTVPRAIRSVAADGTPVSTVSYSEVDLRPDLAGG